MSAVPRALALLVALLLLGACARPPAALRGEFAPITVRDAQAEPRTGEHVRWGGELVGTHPEADDRTCFETVAKPLDATARPKATDESPGRFVACTKGFFDPAVWAPGREITAVGTLAGTTTAAVGGYTYRYPRVDADVVHLWPPRPPEQDAGWGSSLGGGVGFGDGHWGVGLGVGF